MKAWVARRRADGALLDEPLQFEASPALLDLLVIEVTDQGKRRPSRVARIFPQGSRVAVAQLVAPRLLWLTGCDLVLSGIEERPGEGGITGVAQSWICRLAPPPYANGFLARHTHKDGVELRKGAIFDRYGSSTKGKMTVASVHYEVLGRHTMRAELMQGGSPQFSGALLDVEIGWMAEERFALAGLHHHPASGDRPARLVRQGWLCEFHIEEPEDDRPRRKNGALR
jgi:hypothetical protein